MEGTTESIRNFFNHLWIFVTAKHNQGVYNTVCLVVLLTLPLIVFLTTLAVCCHCCCCHHAKSCCCCCRVGGGATESKKKKKNSANNDDLWISVKTGQMMPDLVALPME
ncbi:uncharacterized protein KIAA0040 homolog [Corythoichthys intestinalis]|uniref:uncharacterized protein KIAA0040 homolog n=1 Tax=Corythoichthys intestinalis TaxID=161448 RepID=UPI0025A5B4BB|nr:uncharacterized protein KIAA0040 homolog [Corythoichthys intestinalis]XP_057712427.1 uncharacterized protein KIAA0040 homolog [Corythoichthys intestinalis]XP_061795537.1 uncharacterized protein KIAA0040-like [Nerophis lumbriciformis]